MYACTKCKFIAFAKRTRKDGSTNLDCPKCGSELVDRAYYLNGDVYQGEYYATITLILELSQ